jgi:hypothetical protein
MKMKRAYVVDSYQKYKSSQHDCKRRKNNNLELIQVEKKEICNTNNSTCQTAKNTNFKRMRRFHPNNTRSEHSNLEEQCSDEHVQIFYDGNSLQVGSNDNTSITDLAENITHCLRKRRPNLQEQLVNISNPEGFFNEVNMIDLKSYYRILKSGEYYYLSFFCFLILNF